MNVDRLASSIYAASPSAATPASTTAPADDVDGAGGTRPGRHEHGHGGGSIRKVLTSALDSIGLTVPGTGAAAASSSAASSSDTAGSDDADATIQNDMKQFMQALAQAVKSEPSSSAGAVPGNNGSSAVDPKSGFSSGLSALISQVAGGNAPQGLQDAFGKLASDLAPSSSAAASSSTGTGTQPTLQALLTQLQQSLGYSGGSGTAAVGNLLSTQA